MKHRYAIIGWGIILVLIGFSSARAEAVEGFMNSSTVSTQPNRPSEHSSVTPVRNAVDLSSAKPSPAGEGLVLKSTALSPARRFELDIPADSYFSGPEGRGLLKYLVRCALDADTKAHLSLPNDKLTFKGGVGLAPEWAERALTLSEQRWVSACIFALTNKLGKSVRVDLRAAHPKLGEKTDTGEEKRTYPLHEGGFFGNLFLPIPVSYVCEGSDRKKMLDFAIGKLRLCAQPSGTATPCGQPLSQCGFIITGPCDSPSSFVVNGKRFDEVVHNWLSPEPRD